MKKLLLTGLLSCMVLLSMAQVQVSGKVTDAGDGAPLPGASILEKGTTNGVVTDIEGNYKITVANGATLVMSFIGYSTVETAIGGRTTVDVAMTSDATQLGEVVVTAFGVEREKKSLGYAMTEVDGSDVATVKTTNVVEALAGKVAGLVVSPNTFGPGSSTRVILRGNNSLTGQNQPLYVVDGIPMDNAGFGNSSQANDAGDFDTGEFSRTDFGNGPGDINPDDIESISVLKGPNAAALYGSRASNGVILITTKKGTNRKGIGVSFSNSTMFDNPLLLPQLQNEYGQGSNGTVDITSGSSWGPRLDGSDQPYFTGNRAYNPEPDNVKNFFETGSTLINTLTLEGGNETSSLRFSYTNMDANAMLPNSGVKKNSFSLRGYTEMTDKLSFDSKVSYVITEGKNRPTLGTEGVLANLYTMPRNITLSDLEDFQNPDLSVRSYRDGSGNPYWVMNHDRKEDERTRLLGFFKANYQLNENLSAFARIGGDFTTFKLEDVNQYGHWFYGGGRLTFSEDKSQEINADFLVTYDKRFSDFNIVANFGGNMRNLQTSGWRISGDQFKVPTFPQVASLTNVNPTYYPVQEKRVNSLYGSAQFSYADIVFLDLTARNDWSSTLPSSNRSYFYPSASLSFLVNEVIDPDQRIFDLAKVRMSWAQVGNDTDPYQLENTFIVEGASNSYNGLTIARRDPTEFSLNLVPEEISTIEFGLEWKMFNNRIYGDFTYYDITSKNLIWSINTDGSMGFTKRNINVGELNNKGIELLIGGTPVANSDLTWDVALNLAHNENTLVELIDDTEYYTFSTTNGNRVSVRAQVGGGFGDIYGTSYLRDDSGNIVVNDSGIPIVSSEQTVLGNYQPDWTGGLTNTITYKGVTLNFLIDARIGGEVYSGTDASLDGSGVSTRSLEYRTEGVVLDAVENIGTAEAPEYVANTNSITAQQYFGAASGEVANYIYDQTNIRMREASLTYRLPSSILSKTPIRTASIALVGRNLFFLHKKMDNFDPESSYSTTAFAQGVMFFNMPTARSIGFTLNIGL